jgi:hypothetical protein
MRTGIYAILAVVVGVMLVGMLPGQLSNFVAPAVVQTANLQSGAAPELKLNRTLTNGSIVTGGGGSSNYTIPGVIKLIPSNSSGLVAPSVGSAASFATTSATGAKTSADAATATETTDASRKNYDPYADIGYYALWGFGLVAALAVFFTSKRMLG